MTVSELQAALDRVGEGVLRRGKHEPDHVMCALEFESQMRGRAWSDRSESLPDVRPLNDFNWSSDGVRTAALLPVLAAWWEWADWTSARQQETVTRLVIRTVQVLIAELPGLPEAVRVQCRHATTLVDAAAAARAAALVGAAEWTAEWAAAGAAEGAARAVAEAVWAARVAARAAEWAAARAAEGAARAAEAARAAAEAARAAEAVAAGDRVGQLACALWVDVAQDRSESAAWEDGDGDSAA